MTKKENRSNTQVHLFWAKGEFSRLEILCISSFVKNGWNPLIWTYGDIKNSPTGATLRDAREVLPESSLFLNSLGSYAGFSDYFRYAVLNRFGGLYVDTDVVAIRPPEALPIGPFLVTERIKSSQSLKINGNVIHNPDPSSGNIIDLALAYAHRFPKKDITWAEIGPSLLTAIVSIYPKHGFMVMPPDFANPIDYWSAPAALLDTGGFVPDSTVFLHLYNEMWRRSNIDKNKIQFPVGSTMHRLAEMYLPS